MDEQLAVELFLRTGEEEHFCVLFEAFFPRVRRYFLLRGLDRMNAEDLAQNVMFNVYRHANGLRDKELFTGWLFKIARNELLQHWRRREPPEWMVAFEQLNCALSEDLIAPGEFDEGARFADWMSYLEPAERELARLRFVEDLSYEELAVALGVPLGTIKWRLFNAKKRLSHVIAKTRNGSVRKPETL